MTLSLVFAMTNPERVLGLVLRGGFLAEQKELRDYLDGVYNGRFPGSWERFIAQIPADARHNPTEHYLLQMTSADEKVRRHFAYEWTYFETSRLHLRQKPELDIIRSILEDKGRADKKRDYLSGAILEAYYFQNLCFFPEDQWIMKNIHRVPRVPTTIIHGVYDDVCPVQNSIRLHDALSWSKLLLVQAGHSRSDPAIQHALVNETDAMVSKLM